MIWVDASVVVLAHGIWLLDASLLQTGLAGVMAGPCCWRWWIAA